MALQYSPKIATDGLLMCLDASNNKSYPTTDLPVKGGLVMWMDAADDSTFSYSSGTTVSQWRDKSGFNYHMVTVSAGPTRNAFLNSRKVLAFTNTQDIQNGVIDLRTSPYTIFVVDRYTNAASGTGRILTSNAGYNNWLLGHWASEVNKYYANGWIYSTYVALDTNWKLYLGDWGGPSNDLANFYGAGTAIETNSAGAAAGPWTLGINANSGERSNCEAAEIIVFNRLLTATERRLVHTYLGQKWGISNTDRSIVDLGGNNIGSFGGAAGSQTVANMPTFDFYNKGSLRFDGGDYVLTATPVLPVSHTSPFTLEAFCCPSTVSVAYQTVLGTMSSFSQIGFVNNTFAAGRNGGGGGFLRNSLATVFANTWYHICMTYDGTNASFYLNGSFLSTQTIGGNGVDNGVSLLGSYTSSSPSETFNGTIASARIYSKALSATEVAQNYEAQKSKFANTIVQQGLVLNLDAGNPYSYAGAGTAWYDVSGNNYSGSLISGSSFNSDGGGCIVFDGVNDYVQTNLNQNTDNLQITWEAWFWDNSPGGFADNTAIISNYGAVATTPFTILHISSNGYPYFGQRNSSATEDTIFYSVNICDSQWHQIVGVVDGSSMYIYVDGVLRGSKAKVTGTTTSGQNLVIGGNHLGRYQSCRIASARCYNIALSAAQVLQNYNATKERFGL